MAEEEERPLGWRPYTAEDRAEHREQGFTEEQIDEMEKGNVYAPNPAAIRAEYLAIALVEVLHRRLGDGFASEVLERVMDRSRALAEGDNEDRVEAPLVAQVAEYRLWKRLEGR